MLEIAFIRNLGIMVIAAAVMSLVAHRIRTPAIVGYLLAGLLAGPVTGLVHVDESIDLISEFGIILLLFLVGLELNIGKIRSVGRAVIAGTLGQAVLTTLIVLPIARQFGMETAEALFVGILVSFSSTVLAVKLIGESGGLDTGYGRIAVGTLLGQDLLVILILTFMTGLGGTADVSLDTVTSGLLRAFGGTAILVVVVLVISRFLLPRIFAWASAASDAAFIFSLTWCFLVVVGAEALELSLEIGAFLAGLGLGQVPHNEELRRRVHPLMSFFLAVFFVSLGAHMKVSPDEVSWPAALLLALVALVLKPLIFLVINRWAGCGPRAAFLSGLTMAQISEFSMIVCAAAATAGLLSDSSVSLISLVALITMAASAFMIQNREKLYELARSTRLFGLMGRGGETEEDEPEAPLSGHIIVVGMNTLGREIAMRLIARGETVLAIDNDPAKLEGLPCRTLAGSAEHLSLLMDAGFPRARLVVSALQIEEANDLLAHRCRSFGVPCSIHAIDLSVIDNLFAADVDYLMIPKVDGIKLQNRELRKMGYIS